MDKGSAIRQFMRKSVVVHVEETFDVEGKFEKRKSTVKHEHTFGVTDCIDKDTSIDWQAVDKELKDNVAQIEAKDLELETKRAALAEKDRIIAELFEQLQARQSVLASTRSIDSQQSLPESSEGLAAYLPKASHNRFSLADYLPSANSSAMGCDEDVVKRQMSVSGSQFY